MELLRHRLDDDPERLLYRHRVGDGEAATQTVGQLDRAARSIAGSLIAHGLTGSTVLLVLPPGLWAAQGLLGCALAGVVAVPAPDPGSGRAAALQARLLAMADSAGCRAVLAPRSLDSAALPAALARLPRVSLDGDGGAPIPWESVAAPGPGDLAYLQYTSGSTGHPRGVRICHRHLLANCAAIDEAYAVDRDAVMVSWVPTHHDLGLVYAVLMPLFTGCRAVSMSPGDFVQRPARWLTAISEHGGTHSVSPNLGFELAVQRTRPDERQGLQLGSWRVALNGAEPIRAAAEERFVELFGPLGFRREALSHSYGLSEATAKVTAERSGARPGFVDVDAAALQRSEVVVSTGPASRRLALCGVPAHDTQVIIVAPDTCEPLPVGSIGEVWVRGPSVADGYEGDAQGSQVTFGAVTADGTGPWLRTGDQGFLHDGQLVLTGRLRDLIVIRGDNHHPQDLEHSVQGCHPALRPHAAAAFSIDSTSGEQAAVLVEVVPDRMEDADAVVQAVREAVGEHGLAVALVGLLPPRTLPHTTSGKVQRARTRQLLASGELPVLHRWEAAATDEAVVVTAEPAGVSDDRPLPERIADSTGAARRELLVEHVLQLVGAAVGVSPADLAATASLPSLGIDSIRSVQLGEELGASLSVSLYPSFVQDHPTAEALAEALGQRLG